MSGMQRRVAPRVIESLDKIEDVLIRYGRPRKRPSSQFRPVAIVKSGKQLIEVHDPMLKRIDLTTIKKVSLVGAIALVRKEQPWNVAEWVEKMLYAEFEKIKPFSCERYGRNWLVFDTQEYDTRALARIVHKAKLAVIEDFARRGVVVK